jgi:hypothetical protein
MQLRCFAIVIAFAKTVYTRELVVDDLKMVSLLQKGLRRFAEFSPLCRLWKVCPVRRSRVKWW